MVKGEVSAATNETGETIEIASGEAGTSFDQLESMGLGGKKASTSKEKTEEPKHTKKEDHDNGKEKSSEKSSSEKENSSEKEINKTDKSEKLKSTKDGGLDKAPPSAKIVKVKSGDQEIDVSLEGLVPVKVNGKTEMVSLQQVLNGYSGQSSLDRKYSEYKKELETYTSEKNMINSRLKQAHEYLVEKKDLRGFIDFIAESSGQDPRQVYQDTMNSMRSQIEEYTQLSPEERRMRELEEESQYWQRKNEMHTTKAAESARLAQVQEAHALVKDHFGLDDNRWEESINELRNAGYNEQIFESNPEIVGIYNQNLETINTVEGLLKEYSTKAEELKDPNQFRANLNEIATLAIKNDLNKSEIAAALDQVFANKAVKRINNKINKMEKNATGENPVKISGSSPLFFSDLE